jgi:hypothetical protein
METMESRPATQTDRRRASVRTALVLASIAAVFFVGVIASSYFQSPLASMGVIGTTLLLFLAAAIGRHLRK